MKRKLLFCVAFVLLLAATPPAFAAEQQDMTTTFTAECTLPEIVVTVPTTSAVFINPYQLPVVIDANETDEQIVSTPASIENKSEVPLSVTVTVNCVVDEQSDMRLVTSSTEKEGSSRKNVFIYFEMQVVSDPDHVTWDSEFDDEKHIVVRSGASKTRKDMVTIAAADQPNHFGAFRLSGDCIISPKKPWTENDKINVSITFSFTAIPRSRD